MKNNRVFQSLFCLTLALSFMAPTAMAAPSSQPETMSFVQAFISEKKPIPRPKPTPGPHDGGNDD